MVGSSYLKEMIPYFGGWAPYVVSNGDRVKSPRPGVVGPLPNGHGCMAEKWGFSALITHWF